MTAVALLLLCVAVVLTSFPTGTAEADVKEVLELEKSHRETIAKAVEMCCPLGQWDCCSEAVMFYREIECLGINAHQRIDTVKCLQRHMFGHEYKPLVQDRICCEIFDENDNDKENVCRHTCNAVAMTPSLSLHAQKERIRTCKMANQGLHACFNHCVKWRQEREDEPWHFSEHCHEEFRLSATEPLIIFENGEYDV